MTTDRPSPAHTHYSAEWIRTCLADLTTATAASEEARAERAALAQLGRTLYPNGFTQTDLARVLANRPFPRLAER